MTTMHDTTTTTQILLRMTPLTSLNVGKKPALTPRKLGNLLGLTLTQAKLLTACLKKVDLGRQFYAEGHTEGAAVNGLWGGCNYKVRFQKAVYNFRIAHDGHTGTGWFGPC